MHSEIYQVSLEPIRYGDFLTPDWFYEDFRNFADYIGDEYDNEDDRKERIEHLAGIVKDIFSFDKETDTLVRRSDEDLHKFCEDWAQSIKLESGKLSGKTITVSSATYAIARLIDETHFKLSERFFIEGQSSSADTFADLVEYAVHEMKEGDKLYFGSVIDFHC